MNLNTDHSQRIVIEAGEVYDGAGQKDLECHASGDHAHISVQAYAAGASWSHQGEQLLEILVLKGELCLGQETLGPSSYVRLLTGTVVNFHTQAGCTLYLNQRDQTVAEEASFALPSDQLDWRQGMVPGLKVTSLHQGLTKHTALVRWAPDTRFNPHTHVGGEEIFVVEGVFRDEHGAYPTGSWIRSPHLSSHRPFTGPEGAMILVKVGHLQVPA